MAKYETALTGDFDGFLSALEREVLEGSLSASLEDGSDLVLGPLRCAVRVYERYSIAGGNRVSLNITLLGQAGKLYLSAISSGGSQAVFFKVNTWGEEAFLEAVSSFTERWKQGNV